MLEEKQDIPENEMVISGLYTNIHNHRGIKEMWVGGDRRDIRRKDA